MVCPSCGINNSDDSKQCFNCGYKFSFGYAYNDPKKNDVFQVDIKNQYHKDKNSEIFCSLITPDHFYISNFVVA